MPNVKTHHENTTSKPSSPPRNKPSLVTRVKRRMSRGDFMPPVVGKLISGFGETLRHDQNRSGITYEARSGSVVVSPMDGVVKFSGPFKHYGKLVIIEHNNDFFSMIAGMSDIMIPIGTHIRKGEPLGVATENSHNSSTRIYYELRQNGQPLDPQPFLRDTG